MRRGIRAALDAVIGLAPRCGGTRHAIPALLLSLAGVLPAAAVSPDAILAGKPPRQLSEFGFFADMGAQRPAEGVVPFAPITALFSDKALKYRFVHVPAGEAARYVADEAFAFPVGSALVKTFAFPADFRTPDSDVRLIETRVLLRQADGWNAWAYLWNEDQTDAVLNIAGARIDVAATDEQGAPLAFTYAVPNKNQCKGCHALDGEIVPLGPKARNLNGDHAYEDGPRNQLAHWRDAGMLDGLPAIADLPAVPDWRDEDAGLDARARAWLDVNCAHCHRRAGPASNSGLFLTYNETDPRALGIGERPVAAGRGSGGRSFDIDPGRPENSILLYRVESTEPGVMMPELGRVLPDPEAVALLRRWIEAMP